MMFCLYNSLYAQLGNCRSAAGFSRASGQYHPPQQPRSHHQGTPCWAGPHSYQAQLARCSQRHASTSQPSISRPVTLNREQIAEIPLSPSLHS